jgi:hypothetical protein
MYVCMLYEKREISSSPERLTTSEGELCSVNLFLFFLSVVICTNLPRTHKTAEQPCGENHFDADIWTHKPNNQNTMYSSHKWWIRSSVRSTVKFGSWYHAKNGSARKILVVFKEMRRRLKYRHSTSPPDVTVFRLRTILTWSRPLGFVVTEQLGN